MFRRSDFPPFLIVSIILRLSYQADMSFNFAVKVSDNPTTSCLPFHNVQNTLDCFYKCSTGQQTLYMFSHNNLDKRCLCCSDPLGTHFIGNDWETFTPPPCSSGYTEYHNVNIRICLKYIPLAATYPEAVSRCKAEGGDLIKIDSSEKYEYFKQYLGQYATDIHIQVWVQGQAIFGQWRFHDGTLIPEICAPTGSGDPDQTHMRAMSMYHFACADTPPSLPYHIMCEVQRVFFRFQ